MKLNLPGLFCFVLMNAAIIVSGYHFLKRNMVLQSWLLMVISVASIYFIFLHGSPLIRMLTLIVTAFNCMKVITAVQEYKGRVVTLKFNQWLAFTLGWAGMRAQPFQNLGRGRLPNGWPMAWSGISRIIAGLILIVSARTVIMLPLNRHISFVAISIMLLTGLSLVLHFGILNISAGVWRLFGVNTYMLFKQPLNSLSLEEFWGKRWNIAFSEMTAVAVYRPLKHNISSAPALLLSFTFSGLLHELALTVPVNSGYGLPLLYFVIQGLLVLFEKSMNGHHNSFLKNKRFAHIWTLFWVVTPAPLLFHGAFIRQVVWPLAGLRA